MQSKDILTQISLRLSASCSHASNGLAKASVKGDSAILSRIARQVTFVQNRFQYKRNGRTAYEDPKMA
eukprot:9298285-Pyramimonas_sp.AAC.3